MQKQIDWATAEIILTERDGCDLYGYINSAQDMQGNDLTDSELEYWADHENFYEKLSDIAYSEPA